MKPARFEFEVGETVYGQPLKLIYERDPMGTMHWTIHREAANQRDDSATIRGLKAETLIELAKFIDKVKRFAS